MSTISMTVRVLPEEYGISDYNKGIHTYHLRSCFLLKILKMKKFIWSTIQIIFANISAHIFQIKTMNVVISQEKVNE